MTKAALPSFTRRDLARLGLGAAGVAAIGGAARANDNPMPPELREAIERQAFAPVLGNAAGNITLTEFFDYNCPFCRTGLAPLHQVIRADDQLRVVFREWPIFGDDSIAATQVSLATLKQGKYWEFHSQLMQARGKANADTALRVAGDLGLDLARIKADMTSAEVADHIDHSMALADHMGLAGTPSYIAGHGGLFGEASVDDLQALVKQARIDLL